VDGKLKLRAVQNSPGDGRASHPRGIVPGVWSDGEVICLLVLVGVIALIHLLTFLSGYRRP
jgi:hypothetical protein